jgi:predicted SAM-dependent methyltransferase
MAFPVCIPFFGLKLHPHAHASEVRSVKKPCIHIVHPDGRLILSIPTIFFTATNWNKRGWRRCALTLCL